MGVTVTAPDFTGTINANIFVSPLGGPQSPVSYLDRFPEEIYSKGIDSHLVKFMYALLGPAGFGWLRKNYLLARLMIEDMGLDTFDLDKFFGNPLAFGRILEEQYVDDPNGLLTKDQWDEIRAKDARYRNRALDYVQGLRAGNSPEGMRLIARAGLGHEVEIIENYRALYDRFTDDILGIPYDGITMSTEEMIVLPRREIPQSELQVLTVVGDPTGGSFTLFFPRGNESTNTTAAIGWNALNIDIQLALEALPTIGVGNVVVTGGPLPTNPIEILFTGELSNLDVPELEATTSLTGGTLPTVTIATQRPGSDGTEEIAYISPRDQNYLSNALARTKSVTTIVTFGQSTGLRSRVAWGQPGQPGIHVTSVHKDTLRYVTGQSNVKWPSLDSVHWIEKGKEHEAPRAKDHTLGVYVGYHNVVDVKAYTEQALADPAYLTVNWPDIAANYKSEHVGRYTRFQRQLFHPLYRSFGSHHQATADRILADYTEPLVITATTPDKRSPTYLVNGIYPQDYAKLPGVPPIRYAYDQFWSSKERMEGDEYIELDLGKAQLVNFVTFDVLRKPMDIVISFDLLDNGPSRSWVDVTSPDNPKSIFFLATHHHQNPWYNVSIHFTNSIDQWVYTRYIRLKFSRRIETGSPFFDEDDNDGDPIRPSSIEVQNLRLGRMVSP